MLLKQESVRREKDGHLSLPSLGQSKPLLNY